MCLHVSFRIQDERDGSENRAEAEVLRDLRRVYDRVSLFKSQRHIYYLLFKYVVFRLSESYVLQWKYALNMEELGLLQRIPKHF